VLARVVRGCFCLIFHVRDSAEGTFSLVQDSDFFNSAASGVGFEPPVSFAQRLLFLVGWYVSRYCICWLVDNGRFSVMAAPFRG